MWSPPRTTKPDTAGNADGGSYFLSASASGRAVELRGWGCNIIHILHRRDSAQDSDTDVDGQAFTKGRAGGLMTGTSFGSGNPVSAVWRRPSSEVDRQWR